MCYYCGLQNKMERMTRETPCSPNFYPAAEIDQAAPMALQQAYRRPETIRVAPRIG